MMKQSHSLAEGDVLVSMQSQEPLASHSNGHNTSTDKPSPQRLTTKPSFKDSTYESLVGSKDGAGSSLSSSTEEKHSSSRRRPFPGTGLLAFTDKVIESSKLKRYEEVMDEINIRLAEKKAGWNRGNPYPSGFGTEIRVLGKSETEAVPYLVVLCSPNRCKQVRNLLKSKHVRKLYDKEGLKIIVVEHPPRMTSAVLDIDVCLNNAPTSNQITFCGSPILLADKSRGPSRGPTRKVTFGGIIEVTFEDGRSIQYGMTAGHAIEDLLSASRAKSSKVGNLVDSHSLQDQGSAQAQQSASLASADDWEWESSYDAWDSGEHIPIASILDNSSLPNVIAESVSPLHDWALFEMRSGKPNVLHTLNSSEPAEAKPLIIAARPSFGDNSWDPVIMIGSLGLKTGRLSNLPGAIMRGNSKSFVKTYMLEMDEGYEVCEGDSGAWVVYQAGLQVYGHVVATDILGDAYVMPAVDTLDEIRDCMGAKFVRLPHVGDITHDTTAIFKVPLTATSIKQQNSLREISIASVMHQNGSSSGTPFILPSTDRTGFRAATFEALEVDTTDFKTVTHLPDISYPLSKPPTPPLSVDFQEFRGYSEFKRVQARSPNTPSELEDDSFLKSGLSATPQLGDHNSSKIYRGPSETGQSFDLKGVSKLLGKQNLFIFEKEIAKDAIKGFKKARQQLETLLIEQIQSTPQTGLEPSVVIQIQTLGRNESEATPHLVILCSPKRCKRIRRLVNSSRVRKICEADRAFPPLEMQVLGCSPQMRLAYQEVDIGAKSAIARAIDQNSSHGGRQKLNHNFESLSLFQSPGYDGNGRSAVGHVYDHAVDEYAAPASGNLKDENKYAASLRTKSGEDEPSAKPRKSENLPSSCTPPSPQQGPDNPIPPADSSTVDPTLRSVGLTRERCYKGWDSVFWNSQRQNREPDSQSFVDEARSIGAFGDTLEIFLQDYEDSSLDDKAEDVRDFCKGATLEELEAGRGASGLQYTAWVDDRSCPTTDGIPGTREHKNPLTATQLYNHLSLPRFDLADMPDADRRLIYISNMNPYHVLALAVTASSAHAGVLRNAIWQHLTHGSSLKVTIPAKGYKMFQLEFNLPYFRLSLAPEPASHTLSSVASAKQWTDLSFLELSSPDKNTVRKLGIFEAHFSFVVCGSRENRWVAYAFDNTEPDYEESYDWTLYGDPKLPIWDPREYFLFVVEARVIQTADLWETLVRGIERRITKYREIHPSTLSHFDGRDSRGRQQETIKNFDWTRQTIELVNRLRKVLSETTRHWERFDSEVGDVSYFSGLSVSETHRSRTSLSSIDESFQRLGTVQRALDNISVSCKDSSDALHLRLTLESNECSKTNEATTDFTLFLLVPIAVAAATLQYDPTMMPLPPPLAIVVLTTVFITSMMLLHTIFRAVPGISWWWKMIIALKKSIKLDEVGKPVSVAFANRKRRYDNNHQEDDIELGSLPI